MSKQDVSAVVEQDSSPVVESPLEASAAVESIEVETAEVGSAEAESTEAGFADLATPQPVASAKDTAEDAAAEANAEDVKASAVPVKPARKPKKASAKDKAEDKAIDGTDEDATAEDATAEDETAEDAKGADLPARPARKPTKASVLVREGEVAADFLEQLLDIADLDGDIDVDVDGDRAAVAIVDSEEGRVSRRLVGPDGKVLEALQELTRLAVQSATGERSRLMLDVAGHRAERRAALVTLAQGVIATVKATGEKQPMQPMTAFERKVVHDAVLASGLGSESEGAEPHRFVVILPA